MTDVSGPAVVGALTVGTTSPAASSTAKARRYLGIFNQSATATVYVGFDAAPVAAATAGQLTLLPATGANLSSVQWNGSYVPANAIWLIASAAATPVTLLE